MTANYAMNPQPITPDQAKLTPEEATVTMVFETDVLLTRDDHQRVLFKKGVVEVPEHLAEHPWLKANGVKKHVKMVPVEEKPAEANTTMTEDHVFFLMDRGYPMKTIEDAQKFFDDNLAASWMKVSFLADFEKWKEANSKSTTN